MLLPKAAQSGRKVAEAVSLRDLPATIVDVLGLSEGSPLPGRSLARFWSEPAEPAPAAEPILASVDGPAHAAPNQGRSPVFRGPMKAVASGTQVYIRDAEGREELFDVDADPDQTRDIAGLDESKADLERLRDEMDRMVDRRPETKSE
jgi:arylsulfatase A-like enzyme